MATADENRAPQQRAAQALAQQRGTLEERLAAMRAQQERAAALAEAERRGLLSPEQSAGYRQSLQAQSGIQALTPGATPPVATNPGLLETAADVGRQVAFEAPTRAISGVVGFPVDALNLVGEGARQVGNGIRSLAGLPANPPLTPFPVPLGSQEVYDAITGVIGRPPEAQTRLGQIAEKGAEFGMSAGLGGAGMGLRALRMMLSLGTTGGVASESLGQLWEGTPYEPWIRAFAGAVGVTVAELPRYLQTRAGAMVRARVGTLTDQDWAEADRLVRDARARGIAIMGSEALPAPGLWRLTADVRASPQGGPIESVLRQRPDQVRGQMREEFTDIGRRRTPQDVVEGVEAAGTGAVQAARRARTEAFEKALGPGADTQLSETAIQTLIDSVNRQIAISPDGSPLRAELERFRTALFDSSRDRVQTRAGTLNSTFKTTRGRIDPNNPLSPDAMEAEAGAVVGPLNRELRDVIRTGEPAYQAASDAYAAASPSVNRLLRGDIGQILPSTATTPPPLLERLNQQFSVVTDPATARPETIRQFADDLLSADTGQSTRHGRDAVPGWTRIYLENAFNEATQTINNAVQGQNPAMGANFYNDVMGTDRQRENLRALFQATARANGLPENQLWAGFNRTMEILKETGNIPGIGSQTAGRLQAAEEASGNLVSTVADSVNLAQPANIVSRVFRSIYQPWAYRQLARALTSPETIPLLRQMATARGDGTRRYILAQMLGLVDASTTGARSEDRP